MRPLCRALVAVCALALVDMPALLSAQTVPDTARLNHPKAEALTKVDARATQIQQRPDQLFSFGELGMREVETSKYLTALLEKNGFTVMQPFYSDPTKYETYLEQLGITYPTTRTSKLPTKPVP